MDFVVPVLNEGLVEVAHILPDDPVEFLVLIKIIIRQNIYINEVFTWIMNNDLYNNIILIKNKSHYVDRKNQYLARL